MSSTKKVAKKKARVSDGFKPFSLEEIRSTYQNIKSSAKNFNDIAKLLDQLERYLTSEKLALKHLEVSRTLLISVSKIFEHLLTSKILKNSSKKETNENRIILNKWLKTKYESFKDLLLTFMKTANEDSDILIDVLENFLSLIKLESKIWVPNSNEPFFPTKNYENLINVMFFQSKIGSVLKDGYNDSILIEYFHNNFLKKYKDLKFYLLSSILNILRREKESLNDKIENVYSKWLSIMDEDFFQSIFNSPAENEEITPKPKRNQINNDDDDDDDFGLSDDEDSDEEEIPDDDAEFEVDNDTFVSNPPNAIQKFASYKSLFTKTWLEILSISGMSTNQLKSTLAIIHKRIIPYMIQPERLMDFMTFCYDNSDSLIVEILAINGLFQLMQNHNLEYPSFYDKLYNFFNKPEILSNKFRSRFFRLVDLFLSSTYLPAVLIASFIKRMSRLAIFTNPGGIVIVIPFIYNLLKKHPSCMILIHNPLLNDEELKNYVDPFNNDETNPLLTNSLESSLWELTSLSSHYHPNVATLAKIFSNPFTKTSYNMEDFLDWNYQLLLESESTRKIKGDHMMALEFEEWKNVFNVDADQGGSYLEGWRM